MKIKAKQFDVGEILLQKEVKISEKTLMPELHDDLSKEGAKLIINYLENSENCTLKAQDHSIASQGKNTKIFSDFQKYSFNLFCCFSSKS